MKMINMTKSIISADHAINWYIGNFIHSPNNALRDDEAYFDELENESGDKEVHSNIGRAIRELKNLRIELKGKKMTHAEFMQIVKERGIHQKYYRYKKYETTCRLCRFEGVR